jgi:release factor glutamine methyltransferase
VNPALLRTATEALRDCAGAAAGIEARWLVEASGGNADVLADYLDRRRAGEPVDRILGRRGFWTLDLSVTSATLSPRSDTETIVRTTLDHLRTAGRTSDRLRLLDLGTGTGAILLALLSELPNSVGLGIDLSEAALEVAATNAALADLLRRTDWRQGNWADDLIGPYDIIVSNPPYIPTADIAMLDPEVRDHDPHLALDGGPDGLECYRAILPQIARLLSRNGLAVLELGYGQADAVSQLATEAGLVVVEIRPDLGGVPRALVLAVNPRLATAAS